MDRFLRFFFGFVVVGCLVEGVIVIKEQNWGTKAFVETEVVDDLVSIKTDNEIHCMAQATKMKMDFARFSNGLCRYGMALDLTKFAFQDNLLSNPVEIRTSSK